jgi:hypothetical protein
MGLWPDRRESYRPRFTLTPISSTDQLERRVEIVGIAAPVPSSFLSSDITHVGLWLPPGFYLMAFRDAALRVHQSALPSRERL